MKRWIPLLLLGLAGTVFALKRGGEGEAAAPPGAGGALTPVFLVRHAEKDGEGLSAEGKARAARLAEVFRRIKVQHLVASRLPRTKETLEPLARAQRLPVESIAELGDLDVASAAQVGKLVKSFKPGEVTVIAHHSTTVELIARELGVTAEEAATIDVAGNDSLSLILIPGTGASRLLQLTYR